MVGVRMEGKQSRGERVITMLDYINNGPTYTEMKRTAEERGAWRETLWETWFPTADYTLLPWGELPKWGAKNLGFGEWEYFSDLAHCYFFIMHNAKQFSHLRGVTSWPKVSSLLFRFWGLPSTNGPTIQLKWTLDIALFNAHTYSSRRCTFQTVDATELESRCLMFENPLAGAY